MVQYLKSVLSNMNLFGKQALLLLLSIIIIISTSLETSILSIAANNTTDDVKEIGEKFIIALYKTTVRIYNDLDEDLQLTVHCKSKDDDLGTHVVTFFIHYQWKFRINFEGTTRFWCEMSWKNGSGTFDIFVSERDNQKRCTTKCYWRVGKDGVHGYLQALPYPWAPDLNFPWPKVLLNSSSN